MTKRKLAKGKAPATVAANDGKTEEVRLRVSAARSPTIGTPPSPIRYCRRCG